MWVRFLLLLFLCAMLPARAEDRTLQLLLIDPVGTSLEQCTHKLQAEVERISHRHLHIQVQAGGVWHGRPLDELPMLKLVHSGDVDMGIIATAPLANYDAAFQLLDTPFLFDTYEQADKALDGSVGQHLLDSLPANGLRGLAFWDNGFRVLALRKAWHGFADLQGQKVRVMQDPVYQNLMKLLGAVPVPVGIATVPTMLKSGYLDAVDTSYPPFLQYRMYDVERYVLESRHTYLAKVVLVNEDVYQHLTEQQCAWLLQAAQSTHVWERETYRKEEQATRVKCGELGVTVQALSPEDRRKMKDACRPLYEVLSRQLTEPWEQALLNGAR